MIFRSKYYVNQYNILGFQRLKLLPNNVKILCKPMKAIIEDTRQKENKHRKKHQYWNENKVGFIRSALPFGDYAPVPKVAVDTKQDIYEIGANICGSGREKRRFADECKAAKDYGCKLIFLIEDADFNGINDLYGKTIQLHNGMIIPGDQLATAMYTMQGRYGCEFQFCRPDESGKKVLELLEV